MYNSLSNVIIKDDGQDIDDLLRIINLEDNDLLEELDDLKLISDLNALMINFDTLDETIQQNIIDCQLDLTKTLQRCQKIHKQDCQQINAVSYGKKCPQHLIGVGKFLCYKKCPENYEDQGSSCVKPRSMMLQMYPSQQKCMKEHKECDSYMNDSFATQKCPPYHEKMFKAICIAKCPPGYLDSGKVCYKRKSIKLPNYISFTYMDLIN